MADLHSQVGEQAKSMGEQAAQQAGKFAERTRDTAGDLAERGRAFINGSSDSLTEAVRRNPWMALLTAMLAGYVLAQGWKALTRT